MSPEQALDTKHADARADIYSLGCTLYYLLTGSPVFLGSTLMARMLAHREGDIPLLVDARPGVPEELDAIFKKMVAKEPADRYQTGAELLEALETIQVEDEEAEHDRRRPGLRPLVPGRAAGQVQTGRSRDRRGFGSEVDRRRW